MRAFVKALLAIAIIAAAGAGYWYFYLRPVPAGAAAGGGGPPGGFALPVETVAVRAGTINRQIAAIGTLRSDETVMIRPEVAGRVQQILFDEGRPVKKGQVLLTLDPSIAKAELAEAQASLTLSRANAERSE